MLEIQTILDAVERDREELLQMSRVIHSRPETGGNEQFAVGLLTSYLKKKGFKVAVNAGGLKTAFTAAAGAEEGYHIAFCSEYDALPEIGHGCGHNLIGVAGVAAAMALAEVCAEAGGRVSVIGTPDEEGSGGKVDLIKAGVFDDVDAAMMFHPGCSTRLDVQSLACSEFDFIFRGCSAHAACEPWEGRNALDAVILTFNGINALRQHLKDDIRVHGIITEGGTAPNVVPERACARFCIRSLNNQDMDAAAEKIFNCARGGALATGTTVEIISTGDPYDAMVSNKTIAQLFGESLKEAGYLVNSPHTEGLGSIDMGNVSRVVPSIHPVLAVTVQWLPGHTREFAARCDSEEAYEVMLAAAKAMAITGLKIFRDPSLQQAIRDEFEASRKSDTR